MWSNVGSRIVPITIPSGSVLISGSAQLVANDWFPRDPFEPSDRAWIGCVRWWTFMCACLLQKVFVIAILFIDCLNFHVVGHLLFYSCPPLGVIRYSQVVPPQVRQEDPGACCQGWRPGVMATSKTAKEAGHKQKIVGMIQRRIVHQMINNKN